MGAACSTSGTTVAASGCKLAGGKVELTFWNWVPGMDKVVDKWNAGHPDIHVTIKMVPGGQKGTYQNMSNGLKAGTAPDLGQVEYDTISSFRLQNGLEDISACPGVSASKSKFVDWTWSQVSDTSGKVFAIPQDTGPMAMFVRKDVFDKHGVAIPKTWEEYYQAAKALQAKDPKIKITNFTQSDSSWTMAMFWQAGATPFAQSDSGVKLSLTTDPKVKQVTSYWQKLVDEKLVSTNIQSFTPEQFKGWDDGTMPTWISGAWGFGTVRDNAKDSAGKWTVVPMPSWDAAKPTAGNWGGSTTAVLKGAKHPAEAAQFALWLNTDPEALAMENELGGLYPAAKDGLSMPALSKGVDYYGGQKIFDVFKDASATVDPHFTFGPNMTDTYKGLSDGLSDALNGKGTLDDAVRKAQDATADGLKQLGITVTG
ncbi:sugar ABC transporter substrate-binding protein [Longispora fulva]|uniref:Multiple sugar transport system substrate-binding protein n=1 Tax=Longispora fulva TaxID=619741 RepID=A0A8J7KWB4_9ACTN|nr:extracellular solute-binding protein [Longispora fulva]MBG6136352.1 multiple sugar transport system substrate-binding protein [Longispora fulva]GIG63525.1 sugar ABC transporter substrate-binding protein [Longispora fulva]